MDVSTALGGGGSMAAARNSRIGAWNACELTYKQTSWRSARIISGKPMALRVSYRDL